MTVWIALRHNHYESTDIISVHSTEAGARAATQTSKAGELRKERGGLSSVSYEDWEVES